MKLDPMNLCVAGVEVRAWAIVHDLVAHPLLVVTLYSRAAIRFHDWTSRRAWPEARA